MYICTLCILYKFVYLTFGDKELPSEKSERCNNDRRNLNLNTINVGYVDVARVESLTTIFFIIVRAQEELHEVLHICTNAAARRNSRIKTYRDVITRISGFPFLIAARPVATRNYVNAANQLA